MAPAVVLAAGGFTAGLGAGLFLVSAAWSVAPAAAALALLTWRRAARLAIPFSAAAAGVLWGAGARQRAVTDCRAAWADGARLVLVLEPQDRVEPGQTARFHLREPSSCAGPIDATVPRRPGPWQGERPAVLLAVGTWRRFAAPADRSFWQAPRRPARLGRFSVAHARELAQSAGTRQRLRISAQARLDALFGPERSSLAAALTVTADAAVPQDVRERYARSGLSHLLSISGFHVGILSGVLVLVLRALRLPPDAARWAGTALVGCYVWMLGFPAPAARSAALVALYCWSRSRQRPVGSGALLCGTALAVMAIDPYALLEVGPWLSFAGVWGCGAAHALWREAVRSRPALAEAGWRVMLPSLFVSLGATLATSPISVLAFGVTSPAAVVANLAAVPLAGFTVPTIALALGLEAVGLPALASWAAAAAGLGLDSLDRVARRAGSLPIAQIEFTQRLVAALFLALMSWLVLRPVSGGASERSPKRGRPRPLHRPWPLAPRRLALAAALSVAWAAWAPAAFGPRGATHGPGRLEIHFLSVGQGDAAAVRTPAGRWLLIDGGPNVPGYDAGSRRVVPFLRRRGVRRLEVVVASHGDADHLGGLPAVLAAFPAGMALEPGEPLSRPLYRSWLAGVAKHGARWRAARAGDRLEVDGVTLRVWHPDSAWLERRLPANENSVVLSIEYGAFRGVFPGDAGIPMEVRRAAEVGDVTLLKVGHHGSRTATGPTWLEAVRPEICVIAVGRNRYGHPAPSTLALLAGAGCAVWRTDQDGDVVLSTDGRSARLSGLRRDTTFAILKSGGERR
jgi:competence protein ComEC